MDAQLTQNLGTEALGNDPVKAKQIPARTHSPPEQDPGGLEMHCILPVPMHLLQPPGKPGAREEFAKVALPVWGVSETMQLSLATPR